MLHPKFTAPLLGVVMALAISATVRADGAKKDIVDTGRCW